MPKEVTEEEQDLELEEQDEEEIDRGDSNPEDEDLEDEGGSDDEEGEEDEDSTEDSEDSDDEDQEEDSDETDEDKGGDEEPSRVPKSRLDDVINQRNQERERSQWLESQLEKLIEKGTTPVEEPDKELPPFDYDGAEEKYAEYLLEGEAGKAGKVRSLINKSRQEDMEVLINKVTAGVEEKATHKSTQALENERFDELVESYEGLYPFLDANSGKFDEDKVDMVNTLLAGYVAQGKSKREGLKLAVNKLVPTTKKTTLGNRNTKANRKNKADASNRQPPKTRSASMKTRNMDDVLVSKLSEGDFGKLTLKERKILRGD